MLVIAGCAAICAATALAQAAPAAGANPPRISAPPPASRNATADFRGHAGSAQARQVADWVAGSGDNQATDFFIIDKKQARLYAFGPGAVLVDSTAVLLGSARGDDTAPGIGTRPVAEVKPAERTTPAGRFIAERGHNTAGEDVVWIDYDAAVSMHRVRTANVKEQRARRLATPSVADNRISFGCINVPAKFFDARIAPVFRNRRAMVYVLPESRSLQQVFGLPDAGSRPGATPG
jgi:hypothetical protein